MIKKCLIKVVAVSLSLTMITQLTACGTIFYPERKGTKSGSIDPVIAIADAVGLLFFFIPGIIAFAVDFMTGAIYLPGGKRASLTPEELKSVSSNGKVDTKKLADIVSKKTGVQLSAHEIQITPYSSLEPVIARLNFSSPSLASN